MGQQAKINGKVVQPMLRESRLVSYKGNEEFNEAA